MLLREIRQLKNISQQVLAVRAGISQAEVSNLERGFLRISPGRIERLSKALKIDPQVIDWSACHRQLRRKARKLTEAIK